MAYTTINKSTDYFNTITYTGNGTGSTARTVGFDPDWIWVKNRGATDSHYLMDKVRGLDWNIETDTNAAQVRDYLISGTTSTGWTSSNSGEINANNGTFAAWNWKANGAGSANTDGDINSTVSVNQTAGFSIVKYTGNGSNDQRVGHGLGARPVCWFIKRLGSADDWIVYHQGLATNWYDDTYLYLNSTNAKMGAVNTGTGNPTSSVFYIGNSDKTGKSGDDYIAYVFAEKQGYSKFGSYTGNGNADGTFIYTGFKPAFVIVKRSSDTQSWVLWDNKRDGYNQTNPSLTPNENGAEETRSVDFLSNGFKQRQNNTATNGSGSTYIYIAFASAPLVGTNNIPATAR